MVSSLSGVPDPSLQLPLGQFHLEGLQPHLTQCGPLVFPRSLSDAPELGHWWHHPVNDLHQLHELILTFWPLSVLPTRPQVIPTRIYLLVIQHVLSILFIKYLPNPFFPLHPAYHVSICANPHGLLAWDTTEESLTDLPASCGAFPPSKRSGLPTGCSTSLELLRKTHRPCIIWPVPAFLAWTFTLSINSPSHTSVSLPQLFPLVKMPFCHDSVEQTLMPPLKPNPSITTLVNSLKSAFCP